jgi:hypothetical protein
MPRMPEWRFIIAAYAVTWIILIGYTIRLARLRRRSAALLAESMKQVPEPQP